MTSLTLRLELRLFILFIILGFEARHGLVVKLSPSASMNFDDSGLIITNNEKLETAGDSTSCGGVGSWLRSRRAELAQYWIVSYSQDWFFTGKLVSEAGWHPTQ